MIGLVEISVEDILKSYTLLMRDTDTSERDKRFESRVRHLKNIIDNSAGQHKKLFDMFSKSKKNRVCYYTQVHCILEELVYASKLSVTRTMLVRIEMACLIQDILRHYNEIKGVKYEKSNI